MLLSQTHNFTLVEPIATLIVTTDGTGRVQALGNDISTVKKDLTMLSDPLAQGSDLGLLPGEPNTLQAKVSQTESLKGKLVFKEEVAKGRVSWGALQLFLKNLSGFPTTYLIGWVSLLIAFQVLIVWSMWFMIQWTSQYEIHEPEDVQVFW